MALSEAIVERAISAGFQRIRNQVIRSAASRRERAFLEEFLAAVKSADEDAIRALSTSIAEQESISELLFHAYRSVAFSKSKAFGPRIIGLLTAMILNQHRVASKDERQIFSICEDMYDDDFIEFHQWIKNELPKSEKFDLASASRDGFAFHLYSDQTDSNYRNNHMATGPVDLRDEFGNWGVLLERYGLAWQLGWEGEWNYSEDSEAHVDQPGTVREVSWKLWLSQRVFFLDSLFSQISKI